MIIDEAGLPLQDKYYEVDSTIQLHCIVRDVKMATSVVYWNHSDQILNYDVTRGGIRYVSLGVEFHSRPGTEVVTPQIRMTLTYDGGGVAPDGPGCGSVLGELGKGPQPLGASRLLNCLPFSATSPTPPVSFAVSRLT